MFLERERRSIMVWGKCIIAGVQEMERDGKMEGVVLCGW